MQLRRSAYLTIIFFCLPVFAITIPPDWDSFTCMPPSTGAVNLNVTQARYPSLPPPNTPSNLASPKISQTQLNRKSLRSLPHTPCYLSKSSVVVVFTETSYPLSIHAIKSIFEFISTDTKTHPNSAEVISSTSLWYPGDYPYNNTELFVRMTERMTWGEWRNASTILAFFYTRFRTVGLEFEVKLVGERSAKKVAIGRISLYDQGGREMEMGTE